MGTDGKRMRTRRGAGWVVVVLSGHDTGPGSHVALAPCAMHSGHVASSSGLRVVVHLSRLLGQRHEPPVSVKFGVRGRRR